MGKWLLALGAAVVGLTLLEKKLEEDKKAENTNKNSHSSSEQPSDAMISASIALAENQNYRALLTPKHVPPYSTKSERELKQRQQDAIDNANKSLYHSLSLKKGARQIRVLRILPASNLLARLECKLDIISIDDKYTALSYTWGNINDRKHISVNDQTFSVTQELDVTLRHLRTSSVERLVWIDAISINQADKAEMAWHMSSMREVYAGAQGTFIWLGEGTKQSDYAIDHFNSKTLSGREALLEDYRLNRTAWLYLESLVDRRWWSRIWIVQEAIVSGLPLIICGTRFWKFDDFTQLIGFALNEKLDIFTKSSLDSPFTKTVILQQMFRQSFASPPGLHFEYWVTVFGLKHICLKPEDKVFGLLGLASDRHHSTLACLNKDEPASVIYRKIAAYIVTNRYHGCELDFLCLGRGQKRGESLGSSSPPLPSWVPDLSVPPWESFPTLTRNLWHPENDFSASKGVGSTPGSLELEGGVYLSPASGTVLGVTGILVDTVNEIGHEYNLDLDSIDFDGGYLSSAQLSHHRKILEQAIDLAFMASLRGLYSGCRSRSSEQCYSKRRCEAYYHAVSQTLACGRDVNNRPFTDQWSGGVFDHPCKSFNPCDLDANPGILLAGKLNEHSMDLHYRRLRRCFMTSLRGIPGIVPPETQRGDLICVLYGCTVPVILREIGDDRCKFIGESYVHGVMSGEAVQKMTAGELKEQEFYMV